MKNQSKCTCKEDKAFNTQQYQPNPQKSEAFYGRVLQRQLIALQFAHLGENWNGGNIKCYNKLPLNVEKYVRMNALVA